MNMDGEIFKKFFQVLHMKIYKDKDLFVFVRFGGLNIKKQKAYGEKSFHSPPAARGFYAFPKVAQELFLVGSIAKTQPGLIPKNNDDENVWLNCLRRIRKEFIKSEGFIWHHLSEYVDHYEIILTNGSWIKTSMIAWRKAFSKMSISLRAQSQFSTGITGYYSKDHCEVFFDEKV